MDLTETMIPGRQAVLDGEAHRVTGAITGDARGAATTTAARLKSCAGRP